MAITNQGSDLPITLTAAQCKDAVFIVTGANQGIGLETARHLVRLGSAKVILAVRNVDAGEKALQDIETTTKTPGVAEVWHLDLESYDSIKSFAAKVEKELVRLDGLVENACAAVDKWGVVEGHERSVMVNVLGTMLLGVLLLPKLSDTRQDFGVQPHLVVVGSSYGFTFLSQVDDLRKRGLKGLDQEEKANMDARYGVTKLVENFVTLQLAELAEFSGLGVVVNLVCPGIVKTDFTRNLKLKIRFFYGMMQRTQGRSAEMASRTYLHALSAGIESHGKYLSHARITNEDLPSWMTDADGKRLQKQLWDDVAEELERVAPGSILKALSK